MACFLDAIGRNDHEQVRFDIWLDDDLPACTGMTGLDDPTSRYNVAPAAAGSLEHRPKVHLRKAAIDHSLQEMGAQLEIPVPP